MWIADAAPGVDLTQSASLPWWAVVSAFVGYSGLMIGALRWMAAKQERAEKARLESEKARLDATMKMVADMLVMTERVAVALSEATSSMNLVAGKLESLERRIEGLDR